MEFLSCTEMTDTIHRLSCGRVKLIKEEAARYNRELRDLLGKKMWLKTLKERN